jgi:hypothetical protein
MRVVIEIDNKHNSRIAKVLGLPEGSTNATVKASLENHLTDVVRNFVKNEVLKEESAKIDTSVLVPDSEIRPSV